MKCAICGKEGKCYNNNIYQEPLCQSCAQHIVDIENKKYTKGKLYLEDLFFPVSEEINEVEYIKRT